MFVYIVKIMLRSFTRPIWRLKNNYLKQLGTAANELREQSPLPMNSMLEKEERQVAVERRQARQKMTAVNVPPTTPCTSELLCSCIYTNNWIMYLF